MNDSALLCVMGPTGMGKSDYALRLAEEAATPTEIISVDSVMVYRGLDIGSAKPTKEEQSRVKHHMLDLRAPQDIYTVAEFRSDAIDCLRVLTARGIRPILVGGSMLHWHALRFDFANLPAADPELRATLSAEAERIGWPAMHRRLHTIDPATAETLHPNHGSRILRALEVHALTNELPSALMSRTLPGMETLGFKARYEALLPAPLTERAEGSQAWQDYNEGLLARIKRMLVAGLIDECRAALDSAGFSPKDGFKNAEDLPAFRAVGYRQTLDYLRKSSDEETLAKKILSATRALAGSQSTWLRKFPDLRMRYPEPEQAACA